MAVSAQTGAYLSARSTIGGSSNEEGSMKKLLRVANVTTVSPAIAMSM
jgi:hypothetical protein